MSPKKSIDKLKVKAAEFLTKKSHLIHSNPGQAVLLPKGRGQKKQTTKWQLPNLFGSMVVTNVSLVYRITSCGLLICYYCM
jgi:hypothetical protein